MLAVFSAVPAFAAGITVTNQADSGPGSLRDAIAAAAPGDTINFSLTLPATITLTSGELLISKNLTISGPGASSLTISGNNSSRVFEIGSGFTVAISGLTIQNGSADTGGGFVNSGTLMLSNSTLSGNRATIAGGGILNAGTLTLTNSTLSGNDSCCYFGGGGIFNQGMATVTNSTFSGNSTSNANLGGGGILNEGTLRLSNSTFSGNSGHSYYGYGGGAILFYSGSARLKNTIVANSLSGGNCYSAAGSSFTSQGYNLSDDNSCSMTGPGDLNNTPAGLDPKGLQNNGGPTQTIALLATSAAVDAVPLNPTNYCTDVNGASVNTDQRGFTRPQGPACDIGAFELATDNDSQFSQLNGGNTFTGNQTVNGNVSATNFVGNGSGLTGVITGVTAGAGLTGGGTSGSVSLGLASATCGAGSAITAHPFTCTAFPTFGANTFTGTQSMPYLLSGGGAQFNGGVSVSSSNTALNVSSTSNGGSAAFGVYATTNSSLSFSGRSSGTSAVEGNNVGPYGGIGVYGLYSSTSGTYGSGVYGSSLNGIGVFGQGTVAGVSGTSSSTSATAAAGIFNNTAATSAGNILIGQYNGVTKFSVAASGSVTIGGGTPILEHLSATPTIIVTPIAPSNCITISNVSVPGASDGDTLALGVTNAMVPGGSLNYFAWVSGPGIVTIRVCNIKGSTNAQITGTIRVDIWKH
jgi:hypothetical protein